MAFCRPTTAGPAGITGLLDVNFAAFKPVEEHNRRKSYVIPCANFRNGFKPEIRVKYHRPDIDEIYAAVAEQKIDPVSM